MTLWLKQSTAKAISFGPFVDITDGSTLETGLVSAIDHATTGILLSKNGGALTIRSQAVTASTYDAYGNYIVTLSTTDTNTLGTLRVQYAGAAPLPVWQDFMVVPANVWDSMFGADLLQVDSTQLLGTAYATPTVAGVQEVDLTHVAGATTNVAALATNVDAILTDTAVIGAAGEGLTDLGGMSTTMKAQVETEVDDALGGGTGTALTSIPWNAAWDAEVESEVNDALVVQRLDELVNADSDIDGAAPPTVGSVVHEMMSKTAGSFTFDQTTDSLEAVRDRGDAAWITATGFSTHSAADVWAAATRTLTAFDSSFKTGYALSAAGVQAIWDALTSALTTVGSIGKLIADNLDATISSRATPTNITAGTITTVTNLTNAPTAGDLTTAMKASVNAEVLDVMNVDTFAEPGQGAPAATASIFAKINYLYKAWRNKKTQSATEHKLYADDTTTVDQKATVSDDGTTLTVGEVATGP